MQSGKPTSQHYTSPTRAPPSAAHVGQWRFWPRIGRPQLSPTRGGGTPKSTVASAAATGESLVGG